MRNIPDVLGDVVAPIVFMLFVGYLVGGYIDSRAATIVVSVVLGFCVSVYNVWKQLKRIGRKDD